MSLFTLNVSTQMSEQQFQKLQTAIERMHHTMALNFDAVNAAIAEIQNDVSEVAALVNDLKNRPDNTAEAQAALDEVASKLNSIDAAFDAITAPAPVEDPAPTPEA